MLLTATLRRFCAALALALGVAVGPISTPVLAQDAAATPAATPAAATPAAAGDAAKDGKKPAPKEENLWEVIVSGGWVMIPIGICSLVAVALVFYNALNLREKKFVRTDVAEQLHEPIQRLDFEAARAICVANPCIMSNILAAGLERVDNEHYDLSAIEKAMEAASAEEMSGPYVFINFLNVVSGISTLLGLFGTVVGMVSAFSSLKTIGMGNPQALAGDISVALITTAGGLVVAIPSLALYHYFKTRYATMTTTISRNLGDLIYHMNRAIIKTQG